MSRNYGRIRNGHDRKEHTTTHIKPQKMRKISWNRWKRNFDEHRAGVREDVRNSRMSTRHTTKQWRLEFYGNRSWDRKNLKPWRQRGRVVQPTYRTARDRRKSTVENGIIPPYERGWLTKMSDIRNCRDEARTDNLPTDRTKADQTIFYKNRRNFPLRKRSEKKIYGRKWRHNTASRTRMGRKNVRY